MSNFQVDLTNCDIEPIHIPGQIQSHGFLIVIDAGLFIRYYSDNVTEHIGGAYSDLLGKPLAYLESLLGSIYQPDFVSQLIKSGIDSGNFERTNPTPMDIDGKAYHLIISTSKNYILLEFEKANSDYNIDVQSMIGTSIGKILSYRTVQQILDHAVLQVRQIIGYDRIMIYRFAEDGHGEVVAETKNDELASWIGLHYPASDIPKQARELYKLNLTRLIADVHSVPSKISTSAENVNPLDLTYSQLRAVSPIHIQYLKNMGVASSYSISLKYKDELWGLIACHHYTPRFIDYKSREYSKLIGQIMSSALEFRQDEETQHAEQQFKINLEKLAKQLMHGDNIASSLTANVVSILSIIKASGAVLVYDKKIYKLGITPDDERLIGLIKWITETINEPIYQTDHLSAAYPEASMYKEIASGMLVSVITRELGDYLIWFRPEKVTTVNWAGKPEKHIELNANGLLQISPRHSFEVWSETVSGLSAGWTLVEMNAVIRLKEEINYATNLKAGAARVMNERLREAYAELETFSYTISHDLKNPIASIKSYAQLLIRDQTILERGQQMLQRIADRADQMNLMINAVLDYSRIGRSAMLNRPINTGILIADIIKDLELIYDSSKLQITVGETPELQGDPIMMLQVFSNLIGNAAKYSQYKDPAIIHIEGSRNDDGILYAITDNGLGIAPKDLSKIFELFNRMDNVKDIEGSGVGLAIVKRIIEKHNGKIWAESEIEKGSTFFISLN